jgi:small-conductance mechanosensitive channel
MRYALTYGGLSGLIVVSVIAAGLSFADRDGILTSQWLGYLVMLVALALIFIGMKRYRDVERGGTIRFLPAFGLGLAMAAAAAVVYVAVWEAYLAATDYVFFDQYVSALLEQKRAAGASAAELARETASFEAMRGYYDNALLRVPITFLEIFPVGFVVALASAALLRNPRLLPARQTERAVS